MASKQNGTHYHHPDHVLIALTCIITLAVIIGYMIGRTTIPSPMTGPYPTPAPDPGIACTDEMFICPDGTPGEIIPGTCEWAPCP